MSRFSLDFARCMLKLGLPALLCLSVLVCLGEGQTAWASEPAGGARSHHDISATALELEAVLDAKFAAGKYSRTGADQCLRCHDSGADLDATGIFSNVHGSRHHPGSPFASLQCEACHGPAGDHVKSRVRQGENREPMISFGMQSSLSAAKQNSVCLGCHAQYDAKNWQGSTHQRANVACADCHSVHKAKDPVAPRNSQLVVCSQCHAEQSRQVYLNSSHPLKEGQMVCSSCHAPHGSLHQADLKHHTINDNCYSCHAEKRGPLLWEHQPVTENCVTCHDPHGTVNKNMLAKRAPQLCQSCHVTAGHPSQPYGASHPSANGALFVLGSSCTNCHTQVHGSNHPSGRALQR